MRRKTMEIGDEVEAKGEYIDRKHSNVRKNSWYRAKILGKKRNTYQIQYNGIESIKTLPESAIRAIPTFSPGKQKIKEGDMIEAKWKIDIDKYVESWWEGKIIGIKKVNRGNTYQILYTNPQHRGTYPNMLEDLVRKVDSAHEAQSGTYSSGKAKRKSVFNSSQEYKRRAREETADVSEEEEEEVDDKHSAAACDEEEQEVATEEEQVGKEKQETEVTVEVVPQEHEQISSSAPAPPFTPPLHTVTLPNVAPITPLTTLSNQPTVPPSTAGQCTPGPSQQHQQRAQLQQIKAQQQQIQVLQLSPTPQISLQGSPKIVRLFGKNILCDDTGKRKIL